MSIGDVIIAKYGCGSDLSRIVDPRGLEATWLEFSFWMGFWNSYSVKIAAKINVLC
jgi:hypothetical protein